MLKPKDFAEKIGVTVKTLQNWDNDGTLKAQRTPTNRRYYTEQQYLEYIGQEKAVNAKLSLMPECPMLDKKMTLPIKSNF